MTQQIFELAPTERHSKLAALVSQKLVIEKKFGEYTLYKYHNRVFYDNLWHKSTLLLDTRGLVLDNVGNIAVLPFRKVFNYGEQPAIKIDRDSPVITVEKVNGFLGVLSVVKNSLGEIAVISSTTGSMNSEFVDLLKKHTVDLRKYLAATRFVGNTYLFEICVPEDPHIIPEESGLYLIGSRSHNTGYALSESELDALYNKEFATLAKRPPVRHFLNFGEVVKAAKVEKIEGFMAYAPDGTVLKVKTSYYLVNKFLARSKKTKLLWDKDKIDLTQVDEEFYPLLHHLQTTYTCDEWSDLNEQERLIITRNFFDVGATNSTTATEV